MSLAHPGVSPETEAEIGWFSRKFLALGHLQNPWLLAVEACRPMWLLPSRGGMWNPQSWSKARPAAKPFPMFVTPVFLHHPRCTDGRVL